MIEEVVVETTFDREIPPGGEPLTVLDAYNGCLLNCPYCFQQSDSVWRSRVSVKTNIGDVLKVELANLPEDTLVCVGSKSDPYMSLESKHRLTRQCLQILNKNNPL